MLKKEDLTLPLAIQYLFEDLGINDMIYTVRDREYDDEESLEWEEANPNASAWDHPKVKEFSMVMEYLEENWKGP